jgi:AcrR family transcriptional regulator
MTRKPKPRQTLNDKITALKRDSILDAAQAVFAERGYHRTTIKDVAARADVADGTLYNYFENKDALLSALFERFQVELGETGTTPDATPHARVQQSLEPSMLQLLRVMLSEMLVDQALRDRYRDRLLAPMNELAARATEAAPKNPLAGRMAAATVLGLITLKLLGDPVIDKHWSRAPEILLALAQTR